MGHSMGIHWGKADIEIEIALIILNGEIVAQASQFSLNDVEVVSATVDLDEIWSHALFPPARRMQVSNKPLYQRVPLNESLTSACDVQPIRRLSSVKQAIIVKPEEEIALAGGCWIWDYLRRSNQAGAFLPLSGGIDSCATAVIFFCSMKLVYDAVQDGNEQVIRDARRISGESEDSTWLPSSPQDICKRLFHTW